MQTAQSGPIETEVEMRDAENAAREEGGADGSAAAKQDVEMVRSDMLLWNCT